MSSSGSSGERRPSELARCVQDILLAFETNPDANRGEIIETNLAGFSAHEREIIAMQVLMRGVTPKPTWPLVLGWFALAAGFLMLAGLILLATQGKEVPKDSRPLVVFAVSLCVATGAAFLGGEAVAQGKLFPNLGGNTITFRATSGIAVFIICVSLLYKFYC